MSTTFKWKIAQGLEIRWWKKYLRNKDVDSYLEWKREYWRKFLEPIRGQLDLKVADHVMDAGCGPAGIFIILDDFKVTAVDPLIGQYESGLEHFNRKTYPYTEFVQSTIEEFSSDDMFQTIFCLNAINHVSDINKGLENLFNHIRPKGKLVISIDCHTSSILKNLFRLIPGDMLHPHQYDLDDYRKMVTSRGGLIVEEILSKPGRVFDYYVMVVEKQVPNKDS